MATQITATLPTLDFPREVDYPTQEDWAAFSAAAEENFGILGGDWSTQMQLWKDQANAMSTELNTNATIAQGLADYQGDWTSKGYTLGQTVSVSGIYYICKLTHATGQNPIDVSSLYWNLALGNWSLKVNTDMSGYTSKTTPLDSDLLPLSDSTSSFGIKKLSWANLKATLATLFALKDSPIFTGTPTAPTQSAQDNSTKVATTAYVDGKMVLGTAVSATGTSIDFTGIPSWAKKITIMFSEVSTNEPTHLLFQIGDSGGIENTGYIASSVILASTGNAYLSGTAGLLIYNELISSNFNGELTVLKLTSDVYNLTLNASSSPDTRIHIGVSSKILSAVLDRIRVTTVSGTAIFDSGTINIMYEG